MGSMEISMANLNNDKMEKVVAEARRASDEREKGYRERALKMYPHICGRCTREFTRENLHELTVHHRDHNHDNNAADGSNWELLCLYCHDNEHQRYEEAQQGNTSTRNGKREVATHNPFADLKSMLEGKK
jgi:hypothetical protein